MRIITGLMLNVILCALLVSPTRADDRTYVVQPGDTLFHIASIYGVTVDALRAANGLNGDLIVVGQVLIIPGVTSEPTPLPPPTPAPAAIPSTYLVQPGDTLITIGLRYGISVRTLQSMNRLPNAMILVGQPLIVPGPSTQSPESTIDVMGLPLAASIANISGQTQALPLDCESRSAVDWAAYFGVSIDEWAFFSQLPVSDNPDKGFVGSVYGVWGQIPPNPYGVHAEPIAALLRNYGLPATAHRATGWNMVRSEIARGQPVIAWVAGHVDEGSGVHYAASDGSATLVAPYEHTVMVIGYSPDSVTILDGNQIYTRSLSRFFNSWSALGNQAVMHEQ